jgi:hypothetical protein
MAQRQTSKRREDYPTSRLRRFAVLACVILGPALFWLVARFPIKIAADQRCHSVGSKACVGYAVQKYHWRTSGFGVEIWADPSLTTRLEVRNMEFELSRVETQRWLARDRAILLELQYVYHDSIDFPMELAIVYDFDRHELYTLDELNWFEWTPAQPESGDRNGKSSGRLWPA